MTDGGGWVLILFAACWGTLALLCERESGSLREYGKRERI